MVRRISESYECDVCGREATRYVMQYPDGSMVLDRCDRHDKKVNSLRDEKGEWKPATRKNTFKVWDLEELLEQQKKAPGD